MSLITKLDRIKTMPLKRGFDNIEIEAKFLRVRGVEKLIEHLVATKDITDVPEITKSIDYYIRNAPEKYSYTKNTIYDVTKQIAEETHETQSNNWRVKFAHERRVKIRERDTRFALDRAIQRKKLRRSYKFGNYSLDVTDVNNGEKTEVELEVMDWRSVDPYDFLDKIRFINDLLIFYSYGDDYKNSDYIKKTTSKAIEDYNYLVSTKDVIKGYNSRTITKESVTRSTRTINQLLISKPRDLQYYDLNYNGINSDRKPYAASIKADGVPKIMVITNVGYWFLNISNSQEDVIFIPAVFSINDDKLNSIFVGEYISRDTFISDVWYGGPKSPGGTYGLISEEITHMFMLFDTLVYNNYIMVDKSYDKRYSYLQHFSPNAELYCLPKKVFFMDDEDDFFTTCKKAWTDPVFFKNDGLIITPINCGYITAGQQNNNRLIRENTRRTLSNYTDVCKWKPIEQLTIDFKITFFEENHPIDSTQTPRYTPSEFRSPAYIPTADFAINDKPIVFQEETDASYILHMPYASELKFMGERIQWIIDKTLPSRSSGKLTLERNKDYIIECRYEKDEFDARFVAVSIREDKTVPNTMNQIKSVWKLIQNPIDIRTILGEDIILMRKYSNRLKEYLLRDITGYVLDVGFGKGGDISKYQHATKIIGIEPDELHIEEAYSRTKSYGSKLKLIQGDFMSLDIQKILKELPEEMSNQKFTFSFMYSLTFFFKDPSLVAFSSIINRLCEELIRRGCTDINLVYITLDGDKLIKTLSADNDSLVLNDIFINYTQNNEITIKIENSATVFREQTEYFAMLNDMFKVLNFERVTDDVRTQNQLLNKAEKKYLSMVTMGSARYTIGTTPPQIFSAASSIAITDSIYTDATGKRLARHRFISRRHDF